MKNKNRINNLLKQWNKAANSDDYQKYHQILREGDYTETQLREFISVTGTWMAKMLVYWDLLWYKEFTKDFLVEQFLNLPKRQKQQLQNDIVSHLHCIMEDLDPSGSDFDYAKNIMDDYIALENIRKYIVYCNPLDKTLIDDYNFYPENLKIAMQNIKEETQLLKFI